MFERFTDRARRVLVLAQEEANLLKHGFIGTEHILLGLIHEGDGLAAKALESLGISLQAVREKVEDAIGPAGSAPMGSPPFTPRAKKVLELALREALQLGHNYIGTEHILLGLVREGEGVAAQVLKSLGADLRGVREKVLELISGFQGRDPAGSRRLGEGSVTEMGGILGATEPRYPHRVLSGPERALGGASLGLRVVGVLLFEDGISVVWRLRGVPSAVTRLIESAAATPDPTNMLRTPAPRRAATPGLLPRPQAGRGAVRPFLLISDDLKTAFQQVETSFQPLEDGEWGGSSDFVPPLPEGASTIVLSWEGDSITLTL